MKLITILSHLLTLSLFAILGISMVFSFKFIIGKVDQKISSSCSSSFNTEIENSFISIIEEMPRFPGCEDIEDRGERSTCSKQKMLEYVYNEIKYPATAKESTIEGTVVVRFYIDKQGNLKEPEILKDIGPGFGEEALRVVEAMSHLPEKWVPGTQRGKVVKVYFNLPIKFRLK